MSVTSGQYRRMDESSMSVVVKKATFDWPFTPSMQSANNAQRTQPPPRSKSPWHTTRQKGDVFIGFHSLQAFFVNYRPTHFY